MPAIDAFSGAGDSVEAQKRALLAAVAQQGSQGRAMYEQQQAAAQEAQKAALKAAAGPQPTPQAVANPNTSPSGITFGPGGGSVPVASTAPAAPGPSAPAGGTDFASRMAGANATYFDQVRAAIPVTEQLVSAFQKEADVNHWNNTVERNEEKAADALRRQWEMEDREYTRSARTQDRQWANEDRYYEIAERNAEAAGGGNPLANLVDRLGGNDLARTQLEAVARQALAAAQPKPGKSKTRILGGLNVPTLPRLSPAQKNEVLEGLGAELGLDKGVLQTFLGKANPASTSEASDKPAPAEVERVMQSTRYRTEVAEALDGVAELREAGYTLGEAKARVAAQVREELSKNPTMRDLVIKALSGG